MSTKQRPPMFQVVDGVRVPLGFIPEKVRSVMKYQPRSNDIFIASFPKSGTNWMKQIVNLLTHDEDTALDDYGLGKNFFDMVGQEGIDKLSDPRVIASHLPCGKVPFSSSVKYIHIIRNPKDCCNSFYLHSKKTKAYQFEDGTLDEFVDIFVKGETSFGDYCDHFLSWYPKRSLPNVYFVTYEQIQKDAKGSVAGIANFLGVGHKFNSQNSGVTEALLKKITLGEMKETAEKQYESMTKAQSTDWKPTAACPIKRAPPPPDAFVRKGIIGDWKNTFSESQSRKIEEYFINRTKDIVNHKDLWDPADWMISA